MSDLAADKLAGFVREIERHDDIIGSHNEQKSEIYKRAKDEGFNVKALRKVVAARRKDPEAREQDDADFELYWSAIHGLVRAHVENIEEISSPVNDSGQGEADGAFRPGNHTSVSSAAIPERAHQTHTDPLRSGAATRKDAEAPAQDTEPVSAPSTADAADRDAPLASSSTAGVSVVTNVTVPRPEGCQRPNGCGSTSWRKLCHSCQRAWDAEHGHTSGDAA